MALPLGSSQENLNVPQGQTIELDVVDLDLVPDQLSELSQFGWQVGNGPWIYFPVTNIQTDITQDLAIHKYPDLDGARVENTGRNPIMVHAMAVFVNTITPSKKESWKAGTLYPNVYTQVLNSALSRQTGTLQHPFIGNFSAKLVSAHSVINADFRGGEVLDLQFIETINDENILSQISSTAPQVTSSAASLDTAYNKLTSGQLTSLQQNGYDPNVMILCLAGFGITSNQFSIFTDMVNSIISGNFIQSIQLILITTVLQQTRTLIFAASQSNDNFLADLINATWKHLSEMQSFYQQFNGSQTQRILTYITQKALTLSGIAKVIGTNLNDLMQLNPQLLSRPVIPAYTPVRYNG